MRVVWCAAALCLSACPPTSSADAGPLDSPFGLQLPPAGELPSVNLERPVVTLDAGDGLAELTVELSGPNLEPVVRELVSLDGGVRFTATAAGLTSFRAPALSAWLLNLAVDGGSALSVRVDTGAVDSTVEVTSALLKLSRGFKLGALNPNAPVPFEGAWVHRGTGAVLAKWYGRFVELSRDASAVGVTLRDVGPFNPTLSLEPCFVKEGALVFVPLATGTVAWDLATHSVRPGTPADLDPTTCQSARKGVPRALLGSSTGGAVVVEWNGASVTEVFREAGPVRPTMSADGTTVAFMKTDSSLNWVTERVTLATGARTSSPANGPATPLLTPDGQTLLILAAIQGGGAWQPCSRTPGSDFCQLLGGPMPIGNVMGLALADTASKLFLAVRDSPSGTQVDRLLHVDLGSGVITPTTPPMYVGLPAERHVLRGNLLPTSRGVANALTNTIDFTGLGLLTGFVASDGSVWARSANAVIGWVDHETGVATRGGGRQATLTNAELSIGRAIVSRSVVQVLQGATQDPRWSDAVCVPFVASDRLRRDGNVLSQSVYCSP